MSRVHLPPGWAKFWWFADCIQYDNQPEPQKKHPRFFSERIHAPADSFISENEGMNEVLAAQRLFGAMNAGRNGGELLFGGDQQVFALAGALVRQ